MEARAGTYKLSQCTTALCHSFSSRVHCDFVKPSLNPGLFIQSKVSLTVLRPPAYDLGGTAVSIEMSSSCTLPLMT